MTTTCHDGVSTVFGADDGSVTPGNVSALGLKDFGVGTALKLDTYTGPGINAFIDTVLPKAHYAPWTKPLELDTSAFSAMANAALSHKDLGAPWTKQFGLRTDLLSIVDTLAIKDYLGIGSALGLDTYTGPGINAYIATVLPKTHDVPWMESPAPEGIDSLAEACPQSHEICYASQFSGQSVVTGGASSTSVFGASNTGDLTFDVFQWGCSASNVVAIAMTLTLLSMVVFFHAEGLDWADAIIGPVSSLLISSIKRD